MLKLENFTVERITFLRKFPTVKLNTESCKLGNITSFFLELNKAHCINQKVFMYML